MLNSAASHPSQACFKFMSNLLREKQFIALGDSWAVQGEEDAAGGALGTEARVGILRGGQLRVRTCTLDMCSLSMTR